MNFLHNCNGYDITQKHTNCYQPIKKVSLKNQNGQYFFCIDFIDEVNFTPRIHTLTNGIKIILSFDHHIYAPQTKKIKHKIINGYFFEQISDSSMFAILSLKGNVTFTEKKYTKKSVKIGFRIAKRPTIIIDAGHGGKDPGTSCFGNNEKTITLITALELRNMLVSDGKYNVIFTRDTDKFIPLEERQKCINAANGDILISLHTDSNKDKRVRGMSVYTLPPLEYIKHYKDHYSNILNLSQKFSKTLVGYIPSMCKIKTHPHRHNELKILKVKIPAVLIELGCISNEKDNQLLHCREFRTKINRAILFTLNEFFKKISDKC